MERRNHWRIWGGVPGTCAPPGVQILSFSCTFRQKICKIIPIWELAHPPQENLGSATGNYIIRPEWSLLLQYLYYISRVLASRSYIFSRNCKLVCIPRFTCFMTCRSTCFMGVGHPFVKPQLADKLPVLSVRRVTSGQSKGFPGRKFLLFYMFFYSTLLFVFRYSFSASLL